MSLLKDYMKVQNSEELTIPEEVLKEKEQQLLFVVDGQECILLSENDQNGVNGLMSEDSDVIL
jgi:hypothetical protein